MKAYNKAKVEIMYFGDDVICESNKLETINMFDDVIDDFIL